MHTILSMKIMPSQLSWTKKDFYKINYLNIRIYSFYHIPAHCIEHDKCKDMFYSTRHNVSQLTSSSYSPSF